MLQERSQVEEEKRAIRQAYLQLKRVDVHVQSLKDLSATFTNYVINELQVEWSKSGYCDESVSEGNFNPLPYPNFNRATFPTLT